MITYTGKNKHFFFDKTTEKFWCLCHNPKESFETRNKVYIHSQEYRKQNGKLSAFEKHFEGLCGLSSRMCRYCHPDKELCQEDLKGWLKYKKEDHRSEAPGLRS